MVRTAPPDLSDAVVVGRVAELLADGGGRALTAALDLLVEELGLRSAVLRDAVAVDGDSGGALRAVAGEAAHAVPVMRVVTGPDEQSTVELSVRAAGRDVGVLSVVGARPSHLPVLRASAAVLGLVMADRPLTAGADLAHALDADAAATADRLHDGPVQALVVAHYAAEAAVRGGDPAATRDAVRHALVELRRALWHLRPRGGAGLAEALGLLSVRLEEAGRPPVGYVLDEPLAASLPAYIASTAYRLVQELALADPAGPLRVSLRRDGSRAVLDVDGAPLPDPERWGVRARAVGAQLSWTGSATRLAVTLAPPRTKAVP